MTARGDNPVHHEIEAAHDDHGRVLSAEFVCSAPAGADCRVYPACGCEEWTPELHDPPQPGHENVPQDECWLVPWMNLGGPDGLAEQHHDPVAPTDLEFADDLRTGPVSVDWHGDHVTWRYTDERSNP